ncbi:4Fe-4S dicluster domain-containing protein [Halarcobacter ebronensis]|uniref:Polysulfide reductase chain B n=1 Tax=Halarcobacter ebronensis TaxID=1462615 RepID=A0A4Q1AJT6_9BACT|nr:4Fe-4S dicluster domain-containing protein [Halarcobacter ebronensis]QKF81679.1 putative thiosulfate/polysulfide reductase [4Fe-4S] iron-sulfur binding domain-containing subunit [Halarcobacter ebronensis]RXK04640.1 polysulfide reductase chain B [Halarcobacter ebronensis]
MKKKYRMIHDENLCIGCQACSVACRSENKVPDDLFRLQVRVKTEGVFPDLRMDMKRHSCVMCEDTPCVTVCPTGASFKTEDGLVQVDPKLCVSCKYCIVACPYEARFINPVTKNADKCTFCYSNRVSKGQDPACVTVCPTDALVFGDINDTTSEVYKKAKESTLVYPKAHLGTKPKLAFVPNKKGVSYE